MCVQWCWQWNSGFVATTPKYGGTESLSKPSKTSVLTKWNWRTGTHIQVHCLLNNSWKYMTRNPIVCYVYSCWYSFSHPLFVWMINMRVNREWFVGPWGVLQNLQLQHLHYCLWCCYWQIVPLVLRFVHWTSDKYLHVHVKVLAPWMLALRTSSGQFE